MEDEYPPPREEEDLGPTYTSEELYRETGTVPSRSLLDDLLETAAKRYHSNTTRVLLETRKLMKAALWRHSVDLTKRIKETPDMNKKLIKTMTDAAQAPWEAERAVMEEYMRRTIGLMKEDYEKRVERIRQWCAEKEVIKDSLITEVES